MHDAPTASASGLTGQSAPCPKSPGSAPVNRNVEITSGAVPVFVMVTARASLRVSMTRSSNDSDSVESVADRLYALGLQYQVMKSKLICAALDSVLREQTLTAEAKKSGKSFDEMIAVAWKSEWRTPASPRAARTTSASR